MSQKGYLSHISRLNCEVLIRNANPKSKHCFFVLYLAKLECFRNPTSCIKLKGTLFSFCIEQGVSRIHGGVCVYVALSHQVACAGSPCMGMQQSIHGLQDSVPCNEAQGIVTTPVRFGHLSPTGEIPLHSVSHSTTESKRQSLQN